MPKSRKRRGAKKYQPRGKILQASGSHAAEQRGDAIPREGFFGRLYSNGAEPLSQFLRIFPLAASAWIAAGAALMDPVLFSVVLALAASSHFLWLRSIGGYPVIESRSAEIAFGLFGAACGSAIYFITQNAAASALAVCYLILGICRPRLKKQTNREIFLSASAETVQLMILAVLGGFSQLRMIVLSLSVIGFVPGCYLAAAQIARHAERLEANGWQRSYLAETKSGMKQVRPGALGRLFGFMLIFGPLIPIVLSPAGLLPPPLLITALVLYPMPTIATAFLERFRSDESVSITCVKLAGAASMLVLLGGVLAKY